MPRNYHEKARPTKHSGLSAESWPSGADALRGFCRHPANAQKRQQQAFYSSALPPILAMGEQLLAFMTENAKRAIPS